MYGMLAEGGGGEPAEAEGEAIQHNPLFDQVPGPTGWSVADAPLRAQYNSYTGWKSWRVPGGTFEQLDKSGYDWALGGSSHYYEGSEGMWRRSDHTMMDVQSFMTPEQIAEYGGTMYENGKFWTFDRPLTLFIKWEDFVPQVRKH